jgi:putative inorganic carbon (HCO3(-)) transporter
MAIMATEIISDHPITGIGPGGVPYAKEYYDLMEARNLPVETGYLVKKHLHDLYLHITAEFGIPGLIMLLGIFGTLLWIAISAIRSAKGLEKGLSYGFLWAIVAVGVGEILDCLLRGPPVAIEFFFISGLIAGILADSGNAVDSAKLANKTINKESVLSNGV